MLPKCGLFAAQGLPALTLGAVVSRFPWRLARQPAERRELGSARSTCGRPASREELSRHRAGVAVARGGIQCYIGQLAEKTGSCHSLGEIGRSLEAAGWERAAQHRPSESGRVWMRVLAGRTQMMLLGIAFSSRASRGVPGLRRLVESAWGGGWRAGPARGGAGVPEPFLAPGPQVRRK